ncbi:MAG: transcriptional regulator [Clostridia bacterium]|nr:transcriptional regulator [Clostridia bacterium]
MTIREIAGILDAKWICCEDAADTEVQYAFASDMMSDVLAHVTEDTMLLTGLINSQSVRTAEMLDVPCLVFVRGKIPHQDAVQRARQIGLPMILTTCSMYEACGRLYAAGLGACKLEDYNGENDDDD